MMQGTEGSFASPAAQRGAQGRKHTCIMLLKRACHVEMRRWPLLPAESGLSFKLHQQCLSTYDARYRRKLCISGSSVRGTEGRVRICIMLLKRACDVEMSRWPLLPAESGLYFKLHQESLSTYDARYRRKLCISGSSVRGLQGRMRICIMLSKGHVCWNEQTALLPAESGLSFKLHQESLSTYDASYRKALHLRLLKGVLRGRKRICIMLLKKAMSC